MARRRLRLAQRRQAAGLTQEDLAERLGVDRSTIVRWESGRGSPQPWMRPRFAKVLAVSAEDLHELLFEPRIQTATSLAIGTDGSPQPQQIDPASVLPTAPRTLADDAAVSARFARFIADRNVDDAVVDQLEADISVLARRYVVRPLAEVDADIRQFRDGAFGLLRGRQYPRQTSDLYVSAGRLCGMSAHACLDLGDYPSAATHARTAWACAEAAGHNGLKAWVKAVQSLIAYWNGRHTLAAELARHGSQYGAPGTIAARLASLEARALAKSGDERGAAAALDRAHNARQEVVEDDDMPGLFAFPAAKQLTYAGTTHLAIGGAPHVRQAIDSAESAVALYRGGDTDERSVGDLFAAHIDLGRAHLLAGDTDATEAMLTFVLDAPRAQRSASIARRLADLGDHLRAPHYRGSPQVGRLRERLESAIGP